MSPICSAEEIYLDGSKNRHLPQIHTLALDFNTKYLLSILTSPSFHPNVHVQLVAFLSYTLTSWPPHLISQSLPTLLFQPGCKGQTSHKKDRCASPLTTLQTKQWKMAIKKFFWHHPCSLSLEHAMPGLSSTGSCGGSSTPQRFSLLNSNKLLLSMNKSQFFNCL